MRLEHLLSGDLVEEGEVCKDDDLLNRTTLVWSAINLLYSNIIEGEAASRELRAASYELQATSELAARS